jgi:DNA-directed RNA polymerase subunit M/transcription elongation factor TFIIS
MAEEQTRTRLVRCDECGNEFTLDRVFEIPSDTYSIAYRKTDDGKCPECDSRKLTVLDGNHQSPEG